MDLCFEAHQKRQTRKLWNPSIAFRHAYYKTARTPKKRDGKFNLLGARGYRLRDEDISSDQHGRVAMDIIQIYA